MHLTPFLKNKRHLIWDWNGTILDDVNYAIGIINWMLGEQGLPAIGYERYRNIFDFPVKAYYDRLGFDYNRTSFESLCHLFVEKYMTNFHQCAPFPHIENWLQEGRSTCDCQSILSATDQQSLDTMIDHFDMAELFDFVCGTGNRLAQSKTDQGTLLMSKAGFARSDTLLIGDTLHDAEVAQSLGIDVVLVTHGHHSPEKLGKAGVPLLPLYEWSL
ncbi:MAG: HAD hydrolase-like protein [Gammaproteobacteria bacterium]|nr:HAD hydrolase-like protein [Gammaproteobacteria bacterium]